MTRSIYFQLKEALKKFLIRRKNFLYPDEKLRYIKQRAEFSVDLSSYENFNITEIITV